MMHKAWSSIVELPYCFSSLYVKFQGHTGQNITDFDPNWASGLQTGRSFQIPQFALFKVKSQISRSHGCKNRRIWPKLGFPDCNSSLNSPMAMKWCTKLETAKERCPIVFQGHPSNFKVTRYKTSPILTQIGRFRTICRSQLSNPSDLPCWLCSHYRNVIKFSGVNTNDQSKVHSKGQGQRSRSQRSQPNLTVSGL